jgi:hypothetical protein
LLEHSLWLFFRNKFFWKSNNCRKIFINFVYNPAWQETDKFEVSSSINLKCQRGRFVLCIYKYWWRFPELKPQKNPARPHVANRWWKIIYYTEILAMEHSGCSVRSVPCSLHVKTIFSRLRKKTANFNLI